MDWPKARAILLAAFTVVNLILAYSIWGPSGVFPGDVSEASPAQQLDKLRATLLDLQVTLPSTVAVPKTPAPMPFLKVEYRPTPDYVRLPGEFFQGTPGLKPEVDKESKELIYRPGATGMAAREIKLDNHRQVQEAVEEFMRNAVLMPQGATLSGITVLPGTDRVVVEYLPTFGGFSVFSGYVRVEVSARGIETVRQFWVEPRGYTEAPPKAVRPAGEALLRLAGRLQAAKRGHQTIREIRLGYYARPLVLTQADVVNGWDTVPVWRISLDTAEVYYINAFNGEWESEAN
ncbi:MAG TPA: hypothetical protein VGK74_09760 [Symbiobacteriaceae bacterium]|jgi:hypothetical protein